MRLFSRDALHVQKASVKYSGFMTPVGYGWCSFSIHWRGFCEKWADSMVYMGQHQGNSAQHHTMSCAAAILRLQWLSLP